MKYFDLTRLRGDLRGGFSSGLVVLLVCAPLGLMAFSPLGSEYANLGITAGIYGAILSCFFASLLGGMPGKITYPSPASCLMFSYVLLGIMDSQLLDSNSPGFIYALLTLGFFTVFLCGLIQLLMGLFKVDYLIKFISYSVIAGIASGVGILILKTQIPNLLGIHDQGSLVEMLKHIDQVNYWSLFIGLFTAFLLWNKSKIIEGAAGFPAAIAIGTAVYYFLFLLGIEQGSLGQTVGKIPFKLSAPNQLFSFLDIFGNLELFSVFQVLLPLALSLAVFCSLLSLLGSLALKNLSGASSNSSHELMGQGTGNMISSCFGGLPSNGSFLITYFNYYEGGRTRLSGVICSVTILLLAFFFSFIIEYLPLSVVAGMMIVLGLNLVDRWAINLFYSVFTGRVKVTKELLVNGGVILLVIFMITTGQLVLAIGVGVMISILFFLVRMRGALIKRIYEDRSIAGKKVLNEHSMKYLYQHLCEIKVIELTGMIYFGSAEKLKDEIESLAEQGVSSIVLDLKQVTEIDLTGARLMELAYRSLSEQGKTLTFSHLEKGSSIWLFLDNIHFFDAIDRDHIFPDTDHALEYFEESLLAKSREFQVDEEMELSELAVFEELSVEEFEILRNFFQRETFKKGETIFEQGDSADSMYFNTKGSIDVLISVEDIQKKKRVQFFSPGTFFGEMALFRKGERSATLVAHSDLVCYRLTYANFQALMKRNPKLSITLLMSISRTLSDRLVFINRILSE